MGQLGMSSYTSVLLPPVPVLSQQQGLGVRVVGLSAPPLRLSEGGGTLRLACPLSVTRKFLPMELRSEASLGVCRPPFCGHFMQKWVWLESPSPVLGGSIISAHGLERWPPDYKRPLAMPSSEGGGEPSYIHLSPYPMQGHLASL